MSPSLPPDGEDVLIVNFLCNLSAVTALSAILAVLTFALEMFTVKTALSAMAALTTASSAIFALVTASSAIETVPNSPPNVSSDTSFKFVPSAYAANILEEFVIILRDYNIIQILKPYKL